MTVVRFVREIACGGCGRREKSASDRRVAPAGWWWLFSHTEGFNVAVCSLVCVDRHYLRCGVCDHGVLLDEETLKRIAENQERWRRS